jgi:tRNA pseudouridine38-40 synthase
MSTFKLTVAYDGSGFVGWQRQASGPSIQGLLEGALRELDGRHVEVAGAGRTDAGVHALGQVASVSLERTIDRLTLMRAVNSRLPASVRVVDAADAAPGFHARFDARSKTYCYRIWNSAVMSPFEHAYAWHVPSPILDVAAMASAATLFEGRHDFAAFQAAGSDTRTTDREVFSSHARAGSDPLRGGGDPRQCHEKAPDLITYEIAGAGFLRHMVRTIVGTLVEVGRGRRPAAWVSEVLRSRDRSEAGPTAPAGGLFLVKIDYRDGVICQLGDRGLGHRAAG